MTSDVTIKQKAHQNNPIALFVKNIILKNKNRFGIKLPIVIDFVDQPFFLVTVSKPNEKYYYIPFGRGDTLNAINPLKTKTKNDDYMTEFNVVYSLGEKFETLFPNDGIKTSDMKKYAMDIITNKIHEDIIIQMHDKKLKLTPKEIEYIKTRIKYFKNKMGIKRKIVLELSDTTSYGYPYNAFIYKIKNIIFITLDYNLYIKNKGRLIGNKGFDLLLLHELAHTLVPDTKQPHGKEYKRIFEKYAPEITKNKAIIKDWGNASMAREYSPVTVADSHKHALTSYYYDTYSIFVDLKNGNGDVETKQSKATIERRFKNMNKDGSHHYIYINVPENAKIEHENKMNIINKLNIIKNKNKYNIIVDYYIYKLYEKYGNKKYLSQLKSTDRYKKVMREYKPILKIVNEKLPKISGNTTTRIRNERFVYPKIKI